MGSQDQNTKYVFLISAFLVRILYFRIKEEQKSFPRAFLFPITEQHGCQRLRFVCCFQILKDFRLSSWKMLTQNIFFLAAWNFSNSFCGLSFLENFFWNVPSYMKSALTSGLFFYLYWPISRRNKFCLIRNV